VAKAIGAFASVASPDGQDVSFTRPTEARSSCLDTRPAGSEQLWGTRAASWTLPFRSWHPYRALLSWPTSARSWGHLRKCPSCSLMLRSWPGSERRGVNRVQPIAQLCRAPHRDPQHICLQRRGVSHRALRFSELSPSLLQSRGCATHKTRDSRPSVPPVSMALSWPLGLCPRQTSGPHGAQLPMAQQHPASGTAQAGSRVLPPPWRSPGEPGPSAAEERDRRQTGCAAGGLCSRYPNAFPHHRQPRPPPAFLLSKAPRRDSTGVRKGRGGDRLQIK